MEAADISRNAALAQHCARIVFGFDGLRGAQERIIAAALSSPADIFTLMPTGGGKSLVYTIPALLRPGLTVVISPLLSLIQDQAVGFCSGATSRLGVSIPAAALGGEQPVTETRALFRTLFAMISAGRPGASGAGAGVGAQPSAAAPTTDATSSAAAVNAIKLLFLTPEALMASGRVAEALDGLYRTRDPLTGRRLLARFVVDEAHCASLWGHDWRIDYSKLSVLREAYPEVPIMALTATATSDVRVDVMTMLRMRPGQGTLLFTQDFDRPNLVYCVRPKPKNKASAAAQLLAYVRDETPPGSSGIIYCFSQDDVSGPLLPLSYTLAPLRLAGGSTIIPSS